MVVLCRCWRCAVLLVVCCLVLFVDVGCALVSFGVCRSRCLLFVDRRRC